MQYISALDIAFLKAQKIQKKRLAIMGSTGTIGQNTLAVVCNTRELFEIIVLAGGKNIELLAKQALEFFPPFLAVQEEKDKDILHALIKENIFSHSKHANYAPYIVSGKEGYAYLASLEEVDVVLSAQVGAAGLRATLSAVKHGKIICLANKESLVLAGEYIRYLAKQTKACILPVDSEHYAIFQCLFLKYIQENDTMKNNANINRLILTASGGPFRGKTFDFLKSVKKEDALKHPNWSMGAKITIDSASLMNKGLEIIEACHLYGLPIDKIDVLVHPESIVHSIVEWQDASMLAQMAVPDMRLPIAACLAWPRMLNIKQNTISPLDLTKKSLHFENPDIENFPCLNLAKHAFKEKTCIELNAANEIAVALFLQEKIAFTEIPYLVEKTMEHALKINYSNPSFFPIAEHLASHNALPNIEDMLCIIEERDTKARIFACNL